jgi:hypothetical protein
VNKFPIVFITILFLSSLIVAVGVGLNPKEADVPEVNFYTFPLSVADNTYIVTVEANWTGDHTPAVSLVNSSIPDKLAIELYFWGTTEKNATWETVTYNITIPTDLLWGDISLIHKYYLVDPSKYSLSSNSTHTSLQMTFEYSPFFSGSGYFIIQETEATD